MTEPFSADMARKLAGPTVQERVDRLLETIKRLATERCHRCRTGWDHKEDVDFWTNGGYSRSQDWLEAQETLTKLGYKVDFYYNEGQQFVDM